MVIVSGVNCSVSWGTVPKKVIKSKPANSNEKPEPKKEVAERR